MSCESYSRLTSRNRYDPKNDISSTATGSAQSANSSRLLAFRNGLQTTINNRHRCCHLPNNAEYVIITERRDDTPLRRMAPMAARSENRGGSTSVRGRVRSPRISVGRRWLGCRQPACRQPRQLRYGTDGRTDRRTDRAIPKCPLWRGHNKNEHIKHVHTNFV